MPPRPQKRKGGENVQILKNEFEEINEKEYLPEEAEPEDAPFEIILMGCLAACKEGNEIEAARLLRAYFKLTAVTAYHQGAKDLIGYALAAKKAERKHRKLVDVAVNLNIYFHSDEPKATISHNIRVW